MTDLHHVHADSIEIAAPPSVVFGVVTAMERYGEWSTENTGGYWRKNADGVPGTGKVGDMFVGTNSDGTKEWKAPVEIVEVEQDHAFAFVTGGLDWNIALWRYTLEPTADGGTRLTESYELRTIPPTIAEGGPTALEERKAITVSSIRATLEGMKAAAEAAG